MLSFSLFTYYALRHYADAIIFIIFAISPCWCRCHYCHYLFSFTRHYFRWLFSLSLIFRHDKIRHFSCHFDYYAIDFHFAGYRMLPWWCYAMDGSAFIAWCRFALLLLLMLLHWCWFSLIRLFLSLFSSLTLFDYAILFDAMLLSLPLRWLLIFGLAPGICCCPLCCRMLRYFFTPYATHCFIDDFDALFTSADYFRCFIFMLYYFSLY